MIIETFSGRKPSQRGDELAAFIEILRRRGCRSYLEIGARQGDSFHAIMSALPEGSFGVAVDLPGGPWGVRTSQAQLVRAVADLRVRGYRIVTVIADSQDPATCEKVMRAAAEHGCARFDALMIDADHRYDGVMTDWVLWGSEAALVAFHDIDGNGMTKNGMAVEVPRAWSEIRAADGCPAEEIIGAERGMGIGVLYRSEAA